MTELEHMKQALVGLSLSPMHSEPNCILKTLHPFNASSTVPIPRTPLPPALSKKVVNKNRTIFSFSPKFLIIESYMRNPHMQGTRIIPETSHAIHTAHCFPLVFSSHFHTSGLHAARLHRTSTMQNCMLCISSRFHIIKLHAARLIALPHRRIACCVSYYVSTSQNCMLHVSSCFHILELHAVLLIALPKLRLPRYASPLAARGGGGKRRRAASSETK